MDDVRTLTEIYRHSYYVPTIDAAESFHRLDRKIGDDGLAVIVLNATALQHVLQFETGVAGCYYLLQDYPAAMEELINVMHDKRKEEYEIVAKTSPADVIVSGENTSTTMISPNMYEKYTLPHIQDFIRIIQANKKKALLHMCGKCAGLLPFLKQTNMDAWHAATPPTVGDTPWETILDEFGDEFILFGAVFPPEIFTNPSIPLAKIKHTLDTLYTPRLRRSNILLWVPADGLQVPLERFLAVRDWMEENGKL